MITFHMVLQPALLMLQLHRLLLLPSATTKYCHNGWGGGTRYYSIPTCLYADKPHLMIKGFSQTLHNKQTTKNREREREGLFHCVFNPYRLTRSKEMIAIVLGWYQPQTTLKLWTLGAKSTQPHHTIPYHLILIIWVRYQHELSTL